MTKEELKQEAEAEADKVIIGSGMDRTSVIHLKHLLATMYIQGVEPREKRIAELQAQIEKMKCCANCIFSESDRLNGTFCHKEGCFVLASAKCKLWEN